jgi:hypothetical protein
MTVKDGRLTLPDGMSYRLLVLPTVQTMTPRLLRKIGDLVEAGATIVGPRPLRSPSLADYPNCDDEVKRLADELWGEGKPSAEMEERSLGKGRVVGLLRHDDTADLSSRPFPNFGVLAAVLAKMNVPPDFSADKDLRYIHKRDADADIYFLANGQQSAVEATCAFRVSGKLPEIWDPVTGEIRPALAFKQENQGTTVTLKFGPSGSLFLIFRTPTDVAQSQGQNFPDFEPVQEIGGPWTVAFDPQWGGPRSVQFDSLVDWTTRPEEGVKYYSGKATYRKTFALPVQRQVGRTYLNLGNVKDLAEVRVNGKSLGVVWCPPWRIEITSAVRSGVNDLEVVVVNQWVNRLIGDAGRPPK